MSLTPRETILILDAPKATYTDDVRDTTAMFRQAAGRHYRVETVSPQEFSGGSWMTNTRLLVIPGCRVGPLKSALGTDGVSMLRSFVISGGECLGICGGGYLFYDRIRFQREEKAGIGLIKGLAQGPIGDKPYTGWLDSADVLDVRFSDGEGGVSYYNGGPSFTFTESSAVAPIAFSGQHVVGFQAEVGGGRVTGIGFHPETPVESITRHLPPNGEGAAFLPLIQQLQHAEQRGDRQALIRGLFNSLGLRMSGGVSRSDSLCTSPDAGSRSTVGLPAVPQALRV